jgi:hypothetical protein
MRLTVHLDTFNRVNPMAFAILWLDKDTRQWSREGHFGLDLPSWGRLHVDCGNTLVCDPQSDLSLCVLEGLDLNQPEGPFEGEIGRVQWCADRNAGLATGHWRVQCIDTDQIEPENGVFTTEDNA